MKNKKGCILTILFGLFIIGVSIPLFMTNHRKVKADTITDLTNTTWTFNILSGNSLDSLSAFSINGYLDDGNSYIDFKGIRVSSNDYLQFYIDFNGGGIYSWQNANNIFTTPLTMTITGGTNVTDSELISWLQDNATQQTPTPPTPTTTQITHQYWTSLDVIIMTNNQRVGDEDINYFVHFNEFARRYDETEQTGLVFLGVQTDDPNVQWSYIESINPPGVEILYHGTTNNINNAMLLEFNTGDYMDSELYTFMDLNGYWFDDIYTYLAGSRQGYIEGFDDGRVQGQADGVEYTSLITRIFNGLGGILSIEVFPNITIALLIGLPLLLGVFIIIIKILRG